jgi:hypothetical protein
MDKEEIEKVLDRSISEAEWQWFARVWPIIKMHRDLSLGLSGDAERARHIKCADAISKWLMPVT